MKTMSKYETRDKLVGFIEAVCMDGRISEQEKEYIINATFKIYYEGHKDGSKDIAEHFKQNK